MKAIFRKVIIVVVLTVCSQWGYSQIGRFYSSNKDLSSSLINAIYQDSRGFVWVATEDGLNRMDGSSTKIYRPQPGDSTSIRNIYIRSIFEDSHGRLWFGCLDGLMLYDYQRDQFINVPLIRNGRREKAHVSAITETKKGDLWICTSGQGIYSLKANADYSQFVSESDLCKRLGTYFFQDIKEDAQGQLWIASEAFGLFKLSSSKKVLEQYNASNKLGSNSATTICIDKGGNLFVGTLNGGVSLYSRATNQFNPITCRSGSCVLDVRVVFVDSKNRVLVGTDGMGVKLLNRELGKLEDYAPKNMPFDLSRMKVHTIMEDRDQNLWFGLFQKGVLVQPSYRPNFDYYGHKSFQNNSIGTSCVMSIGKDAAGVIWVGTDNDGLYGIDDAGRQVKRFTPSGSANGVPPTITSLLCDEKGTIWLGSYSKGLSKLDPRSGRCEHIKLDPSANVSSGEKVFTIFKDSHANLWIGTYGKGLFRRNPESGDMQHFAYNGDLQPRPNEDCLPNDWVNCIVEGRSGYIWVGTFDGFACFNPRTGSFINYGRRSNLMPGSVVYQLLEAVDGTVWIGTSQGLFHFFPHSMKFEKFTSDDGLANNIVCGLEQDSRGNIWISTHNGISKFVPSSKTFTNFYSPSWLQNNEFSRGASFKDKKGKIYFGGIDGVAAFYPELIQERKSKLAIRITSFYVLNKPIQYGDKSGGRRIVNKAVPDASEFHLSHSDNVLTLDFSVFDFVNSDQVVYQYRIEEINSTWVSLAPGTSSLTLAGLLPGTYTLEVKAEAGNVSSDIKRITITIAPPWYRTVWAIIIYIILLALAGRFAFWEVRNRIRAQQELEKSRHLQEINEQKLQFFINISHEIRTPMSLIIAPLEKLLKDVPDGENRRLYQLMRANAERILLLVNQLMDVRKLEKGQMVLRFSEIRIGSFLHAILDLVRIQAERKSINLIMDIPNPDLKVWIDPNNFDKVIVNLLSNALKFTSDGGSIRIAVAEEQNGTDPKSVLICVEDNGIGIVPDKVEKIFERFYQITSGGTKPHQGTGLGLHLSKLLVEQHGGFIWAENRVDGQGARFFVRLPLGNEHLRSDQMVEPDAGAEYQQELHPQVETFEELEPAKVSKNRKSKSILIVDDEVDIRRFLRDELSSLYTILEASNGKEALDIALNSKPDLIISDVMMPEMNGYSFVKRVRQNININDVPIILLTAKSGLDENLEGISVGADAYLTKPFSVDLLKRTIENLIQIRQQLKNKFTGNENQSEKLEAPELRSADELFVEKVMRVISDHIDDPMLNVEFIADKVGLSRVHVYRKLKTLTNQSARDFIRNIRLKQAAVMLSQKHHMVADVAYASGFTSLSHFSTAFKEFYGVTPKEWMSQNGCSKVDPSKEDTSK